MKWMPSQRLWIWGCSILLGVVTLSFLSLTLSSRSQKPQHPAQPLITALGEWETDPALWGRNFPRQYRSWLLTQEPNYENIGYGSGRTKWGGMRPDRRDPEAGALYAGNSLSRDQGGMPRQGDAAQIRHPAICLDCHDPRTMTLRVSRQAFREAMARRGIEVDKASRQSMRTYVCAQCHVTHSVFGESEGPRLLLDRGLNIDDILATYQAEPFAKGFSDWTHAVSKTPLIKLRHPEFELWSQGVHASRGVSCADCHMPVQVEGTVRLSNHHVQSPLLNQMNASCLVCHHWSVKELQQQVELIQDRTMSLEKRTAMALLDAHAAVGACERAGLPEARMAPIRALLREAQARWDFIASEGSTGFHASQEAARVLAIAIDQARQGERDALLLKEKVP